MRHQSVVLTILTLMISAVQTHAFSIDATDTPSVQFHNPDPAFALFQGEFQAKMNAEVRAAFDTTISKARVNLEGFKEQKELAQAFGNANVYSVNSATLQGFQNYSLFAVASGLMVGVQAPSTNLSYYSHAAKDIQTKGDLYAGLGAGLTYLNVGVNAKFLYPGLYLNVKYGAFSKKLSDFKMKFSVMGVGANYRLLDTKSLIGLVKWRGVSLGTGVYVQSNKLNMQITPDSISTPAHFHDAVMAGVTPADSAEKELLLTEMGYGKNAPDANVVLSPTFNMGLDITTVTVPFDAATSVSLLFGVFNVTAGMGFDLNFGSSKVVLTGDSKARIDSTQEVTFSDAAVHVDGSSKNSPSVTRLRAMTGVGVGLGPVKIDVPLIYYFNSGMAFGVTLAVVW